MTTGFKTLNGFLWPETDHECAQVAWAWLPDLDKAIGLCKGRAVALQAGGNCGVWPKHLARHFERVYTWEPDPANFHCLTHNATEANVVKFQAALGNKPAWIDLNRRAENVGAYTVKPGGILPTMRIDDLGLDACDLVYLDVEGSELNALRGAAMTLEKFRPVVAIEENQLCEQFGVARGEVGRWLELFGYREVLRSHNDIFFTCH